LKARLALANFKRERGLENFDLRMLESSLLEKKTARSPIQYKSKKKTPRFYPGSSPQNDMNRLINKNASHTSVSIPISEQRSTSPQLNAKTRSLNDMTGYSSDDEDAAHLLVMMHQSPTMLA
jgi:hypothetical protein